jgi:hypothetical protein
MFAVWSLSGGNRTFQEKPVSVANDLICDIERIGRPGRLDQRHMPDHARSSVPAADTRGVALIARATLLLRQGPNRESGEEAPDAAQGNPSTLGLGGGLVLGIQPSG